MTVDRDTFVQGRKISDIQLSALVPSAVRWPERGATAAWEALHDGVETLKGTVREVDERIAAVYANRDLSPDGQARQAAEIASAALAELEEHKAVARARSTVERHVEHFNKKVIGAVKRAEAPLEEMRHREIREYVSRVGGNDVQGRMERRRFVEENLGDPEFRAAVLTAPGYLTGLSAEELAHLKSKAEAMLEPEAMSYRDRHVKALEDFNLGVQRAKRRIAERVGFVEVGEGNWRPRATLPGAA